MSNDSDRASGRAGQICIDDALYLDLTDGARRYFDCTVKEYADKLRSEASNIEKMEHAGTGDAEITAAHVEEAKWVLIRRLRKSANHSRLAIGARIGQTLMAAAVGVGGSNFAQTWGAVMCLVGVIVGSILLVVEREVSREI